ncbi:MAG TPA: EF-P lysine aminoacylase EpmA [Steroidobacteraceae bacterium]|nr:EF-P lysine aminoacylase EpmA [Steroidobacteraceae bacterium]
MTSSRDDWRPTATRERLEKRAAALAQVRSFFAARGVMEVDTPMVVNAPVTDVHIHSAEVRFPDDAATATGGLARFFLHTSPEFAMKRLLAARSGDIYQICHVVRGLERGRHHNAEFTLVEWYRLGFTLEQLMQEVDALTRAVLGPVALPFASEYLTYREAFVNALGIDPLAASLAELRSAALDLGFTVAATSDHASRSGNLADSGRDELLDFLMAAHIGPRLGRKALTFIHGYPASQAALARLDRADPRTALRFELYCEGIELANGFHELAAAAEQRARFEQDLAERKARGLPVYRLDERLLAALEHGLPDCAGVALGFDRLVMLATGASHIDEVLPFPTDRA